MQLMAFLICGGGGMSPYKQEELYCDATVRSKRDQAVGSWPLTPVKQPMDPTESLRKDQRAQQMLFKNSHSYVKLLEFSFRGFEHISWKNNSDSTALHCDHTTTVVATWVIDWF